MVTWAKENAVSSGLKDAPIRWIVDDCVKSVSYTHLTDYLDLSRMYHERKLLRDRFA